MDEITANHISIYFDPEMEEFDGQGWCMEAYPGSTTFRFETFDALIQAIRFQQSFLNASAREYVTGMP